MKFLINYFSQKNSLRLFSSDLLRLSGAILFCICLGIFTGCNTSLQELEPSKAAFSLSEEVELIDGRLHITSIESFNKLFEEFAKNQNNPLGWNSKINEFKESGFISMRDAHRNFNEDDIQAIVDNGSKLFGEYERYLTIRGGDDGELEAVSVIPHPFLSRITNSEGLLQIGDEVRRYFYDYYLMAISPSFDQIKTLKEATEGKVLGFSEKIEIYRHNVKDVVKTTCAGNTNAKTPYASSPKRRINATLVYECTNVGVASYLQSFYSEVKNQRKNGFWWARKADEINTSVTGSTNNQGAWNIGPWDTGSSNGTVTNEKKIDLLFAYFYTNTCYPDINAVTFDFDGNHDLTDKDGSSTGSTSNDRYCN